MATYTAVAVARTPAELTGPTLVELGPLTAKLSWTEEVTGAGEATLVIPVHTLTSDIKTRLRDLSLAPLEVIIYRDSTVVFNGPVVGGKVKDNSLTLHCRGLLYYLAYMLVITDKSWSGIDQALIAAEMIDDWQALDYGDYGLDTSTLVATGVTRDVDINGVNEHPNVLDQVLALGANVNGFDIYVDPDTREVIADSPERGVDLSASVFLERGITSLGADFSVAPGIVASDIFATGTGPSLGTALTATANTPALRVSFGRCGFGETIDPINEQAQLDDAADELAATHAAQLFQPAVGSLIPVSGALYEDFEVGDRVSYAFDSGLGMLSSTFRVLRRKVDIGDDGTETMSVEFE